MNPLVAVLIIDDNANMRKTLKNVLADTKCTILEAESGDEALERIASGYFDLVFIDNKLPGPDGLEVLRAVRERHLAIGSIFFLTGYPTTEIKMEAERLGVFHFQGKDSLDLLGMGEKINEAIMKLDVSSTDHDRRSVPAVPERQR
ncbi:MAG TPA: response regulator [Pyrinomonadaceae bacterium]|nr:response regulator [Pyrinomonadaceae bacterium]